MKSTIRLTFTRMSVLCCLALGLFITSCSKKSSAPPPNTASLTAAIDSANLYLTATTEGTKPGEYTTGSKATLTAALAAASAILSNSSSSQTDITNAAANLLGAVTAYKGNFIQQIAVANLIAYWKFNGNANDSSGNGHNGTATVGHAYYGAGVPALTVDRFGNANSAYHLDKGANIDIPTNPAFNPQQMTISLWCKPDTTGRMAYNSGTASTVTLMSLDRWFGWKFQFQPYKPFFTFCTTAPTAANTYNGVYVNEDDVVALATIGQTWYHVVVTYAAGTMNFYVNGSLTKSWTGLTGNPVTINPAVDLVIGQDLPTSVYTTVLDANSVGYTYVNWGGYWSGDIDDVMFYNIALTGPQVASIYTNQNTQ
jgi:hypothetical protein